MVYTCFASGFSPCPRKFTKLLKQFSQLLCASAGDIFRVFIYRWIHRRPVKKVINCQSAVVWVSLYTVASLSCTQKSLFLLLQNY